MIVSNEVRALLRLCAIRVENKSLDWSMVARAARTGALEMLLAGDVPHAESVGTRTSATPILRYGLAHADAAEERVTAELDAADAAGARLITVLDEDYPANLTDVPDLPPFLFVRGSLAAEDACSAAVVGTRQASAVGLDRAARMSRELVQAGVTVVSGLARGVDTAGHSAALEAGGRTIAVMGTGITKCYPAENRELAERITTRGALVSQFWPTRTPGRDTFPRRNRVTSGISRGSVVIEASRTSGAKMQARLAAEHRKHVWLIASLVDTQDWARKMISEGRATVVRSSEEVISSVLTPAPKSSRLVPAAQETLEFE